MAGRFISFEGIDGSGKSTQVRTLATTLRAGGAEVVETREPGGAPGAELIRALLVYGDTGRWSPETEILLFTAARRDHLERTIRPALDRGATVISDRFANSTRVYQGVARADLRATVDALHALAIGIEPDLTLILDLARGRRSPAASPAAARRTASSASARTSRRACARASWRSPPSSPAAAASCRPHGDADGVAARVAAVVGHDRRARRARPPARRPAPARDRRALRPGRGGGALPRSRRRRPPAPRLARSPARAASARRPWPGASPGTSIAGDAAPTLDMAPDHPVFRQLAALGSPQLFLCRRPWDDKAERLRIAITVDEVRAMTGFFHLSAADGGRRVAIVDAADELNGAAANALLKLLEEPPARAVLLLVCHRPAALLPTLRSRCRVLRCEPLGPAPLAAALAAAGAARRSAGAPLLAALAGGSVGAALRLAAEDGARPLRRDRRLLGRPPIDRRRAIALADAAGGRQSARYELTLELLGTALGRLALAGAGGAVAALTEAEARDGRGWPAPPRRPGSGPSWCRGSQSAPPMPARSTLTLPR